MNMNTKYQLDRIDQRILSFLVKNARMPFLEIARECGVSGAAILLVKPQALGLNVCAFVGVSLSETSKYNEVIQNLRKIPEVVECHFVTGKHALLVKIYCTDHDHLMRILVHTIQNIPYISSTDTMISLDQAIERQVWVDDVPVKES